MRRLEDYMKKCKEKLVTATRYKINNTIINRQKTARKQNLGIKSTLRTFQVKNK